MESNKIKPEQEQPSTGDAAEVLAATGQPVASNRKQSKLPVVLGFVILIVAIGIGTYFAFHSSAKTTPSSTASTVPAVKKITPAEVSITSTGFDPATITIKAGQAVTWTNTDSTPHQVASDPYPTDNTLAGFNAKQSMSLNDSYSFIFAKAGTYTYHDDLNPYSFRGTVVVE